MERSLKKIYRLAFLIVGSLTFMAALTLSPSISGAPLPFPAAASMPAARKKARRAKPTKHKRRKTPRRSKSRKNVIAHFHDAFFSEGNSSQPGVFAQRTTDRAPRRYPDSRVARGCAVSPNQNANFSASCTSRGGAAFTTWPNRVLEKSPDTDAGPKNWVWLNTLKASSRNCRVFDSGR